MNAPITDPFVLAVALGAAVVPSSGHAHPESTAHLPWFESLGHLLTSPDHIVTYVGLAAAAVVLGRLLLGRRRERRGARASTRR